MERGEWKCRKTTNGSAGSEPFICIEIGSFVARDPCVGFDFFQGHMCLGREIMERFKEERCKGDILRGKADSKEDV